MKFAFKPLIKGLGIGVFALTLLNNSAISQDSTEANIEYNHILDSIENTLIYQNGSIELANGIGVVNVPEGFKYLDAKQAEYVIVDLWGNPPEEDISLGMLLPSHQGIMDDGYVFNIEYEAIGYVEDDDAEDIDYDELLEEIQAEAKEANTYRVEQGYEPIDILGWAQKPYYDKDKKVLHWAKELKFGDAETNTLNYNVRVLGRKGVMVLNAIATMNNLEEVKRDIPQILDIVQFSKGQNYADFDSSVDEVAAWTIGGLVAGKVLAKAGFFALLLKFWKIIAIAVAGFFGAIFKKVKSKKAAKALSEIKD